VSIDISRPLAATLSIPRTAFRVKQSQSPKKTNQLDDEWHDSCR